MWSWGNVVFVRCCGAESSGQVCRLSTSTAYDCSLNTHDYLFFADDVKQPIISALAHLVFLAGAIVAVSLTDSAIDERDPPGLLIGATGIKCPLMV